MDAAAVATITSAVDFSTIINGISAIAGAIALVLISSKGAKMLLGQIRGS